MRNAAGCDRKHRKHRFACPNLVAVEFGCWRPSALNWSVAWPPARPPNKMPIAPRSSCVLPRARRMQPLPRTWVWPSGPSGSGVTALPSSAWTDSKTVPSVRRRVSTMPTSRPGCWCWPVRNQPRSTRPVPVRRTGRPGTWPSTLPPIPNWAWAVPAKAPSASFSSDTRFAWTVFDTWMNDRDREFAYVRNGTVDLPAGFRVNDGQVYGMVRLQHRSREFCELLALLDEQTPADLPIHLILDPVSSHGSAEVANWLDAHPHRTFVFHFLPVHASWLSFIEVWFSIISRKCLKRADFADATVATQQIEGFITNYNTHSAHPFTWKKGVRFYNRLKAKIAARQKLRLAA